MSTTPNLGLTQPQLGDDIKLSTIPALSSNFGTIDSTIGNPSNLTTPAANLVASINDKDSKITTLQADNAQRSINVMHPPAPLVAAKGDGITDDTSAIQACINYLTNGGIVFFPYSASPYLTKQLTIPTDNIILRGSGVGSSLKFNAAAGTAGMIFATGRNNVIVDSLKLDGNNIDMYGKGLVYLQQCNNSGIINCYITNTYSGSAAILLEGTKHCFARFNKVISVGYGIICGTVSTNGSPTADYNYIESNYLDTTTHDAIFVTASLSSTTTTNVNTSNVISNNVVRNSSDAGIESGIGNNNCVIQGNRVYNSSGPNILLRNNVGSIVNGNYCKGSTGLSGTYGGGIFVDSQVSGTNQGIAISNNVCESNTGEGISINQTSRGINVSDNVCKSNGGYGIAVFAGAYTCTITGNTSRGNSKDGILLQSDGTTNFGRNSVSGNNCSNNTSYGINCQSSDNTIVGNMCSDDQTTKTQQYGIYLTGSSQCNFNMVDGNNCNGNSDPSYGIFLAATTGLWNVITWNNINGGNQLRRTRGTATMAASTTSIVVNHNLYGGSPNNIKVTPQGSLGNVWVTNITATQFTINCSVAPAGNTPIYWDAEV